MDEDKFNRTIDILVQNQAQFYADLQKIQETDKAMQATQQVMQEIQKESEKRISELEKTMQSLVRVTLRTSETVEKLADAQKHTDERLNAVIFMAEKFFSRNNGDSDKNKTQRQSVN